MSTRISFLGDEDLENFMEELENVYPRLYDFAQVDNLEVELNGLSLIEVEDIVDMVDRSEGDMEL